MLFVFLLLASLHCPLALNLQGEVEIDGDVASTSNVDTATSIYYQCAPQTPESPVPVQVDESPIQVCSVSPSVHVDSPPSGGILDQELQAFLNCLADQ